MRECKPPFDSPDENVAYRGKAQIDEPGTDYTGDNCVGGGLFLLP